MSEMVKETAVYSFTTHAIFLIKGSTRLKRPHCSEVISIPFAPQIAAPERGGSPSSVVARGVRERARAVQSIDDRPTADMADQNRPSTPELRAQQKEEETESKIVKVLTVMAYLCSVSTGAFLLSLYYIFLWEPKVENQKRL
ncbi:Hypothetical predicted protein [Cloeon dipterum]|uniref:Uncharacterized protein n=1 Tax=Cloeon dipterum TaxID=197152 RepID=A0A8S1CIP5_9INSE|nr:Hypothetical predicted protein [Cloeon dipterum]